MLFFCCAMLLRCFVGVLLCCHVVMLCCVVVVLCCCVVLLRYVAVLSVIFYLNSVIHLLLKVASCQNGDCKLQLFVRKPLISSLYNILSTGSSHSLYIFFSSNMAPSHFEVR